MPGINFPAIEECPECGSERLWAVEHAVQGVTLDLDGSGGIATAHTDDLMAVTYTSIGCVSCDEMLVEDGEVVHSEVDA